MLDSILKRAREIDFKIVFPEGNEYRTLLAAAYISKNENKRVVLLGEEQEIVKLASKYSADIRDVEIINPKNDKKCEKYGKLLLEIRKGKNLSEDDALEIVKNPLYFGTMMVETGDADGMLAGARSTTGDVLRPALQIVKTAPGIKTASGGYAVLVPNCRSGAEGMFLFTDCGVTPNPSAEQLAEISFLAAKEAELLFGIDPKVALLSFSTKGCSEDPSLRRIKDAFDLVKKRYPNLLVDGELQADTAIMPDIADIKDPEGVLRGRANVLVFPDLHSANISYKLVQRLAKANAIGLILQGVSKPINDLSRGCTSQDIIAMSAITALQKHRKY